MKVTILDMQPIEPATGGGRLRLLGLYYALGEGIQSVVGTLSVHIGQQMLLGRAIRRIGT